VYCALTGIDKTSHSAGHDAAVVAGALDIVDGTLATLRADGERGGWWDRTTVFVVSDHGHSPVPRTTTSPTGCAGAACAPSRIPFTMAPRREAAVMVSGNAMAHVYLELARRRRPWWGALAGRWAGTVDALAARPSVDLVLLPLDADRCEVRHAGRGAAVVERAPAPAGRATARASRTATPTARSTAAIRWRSAARSPGSTPTPPTTRAPRPTTPTPSCRSPRWPGARAPAT
jgi:hypothetical protein